jgi:hypothetical protein
VAFNKELKSMNEDKEAYITYLLTHFFFSSNTSNWGYELGMVEEKGCLLFSFLYLIII